MLYRIPCRLTMVVNEIINSIMTYKNPGTKFSTFSDKDLYEK
jgi:hypothetical protein